MPKKLQNIFIFFYRAQNIIIFMSGDYEFLCRIYGLSGASGNLEPQSCIIKLYNKTIYLL